MREGFDGTIRLAGDPDGVAAVLRVDDRRLVIRVNGQLIGDWPLETATFESMGSGVIAELEGEQLELRPDDIYGFMDAVEEERAKTTKRRFGRTRKTSRPGRRARGRTRPSEHAGDPGHGTTTQTMPTARPADRPEPTMPWVDPARASEPVPWTSLAAAPATDDLPDTGRSADAIDQELLKAAEALAGDVPANPAPQDPMGDRPPTLPPMTIGSPAHTTDDAGRPGADEVTPQLSVVPDIADLQGAGRAPEDVSTDAAPTTDQQPPGGDPATQATGHPSPPTDVADVPADGSPEQLSDRSLIELIRERSESSDEPIMATPPSDEPAGGPLLAAPELQRPIEAPITDPYDGVVTRLEDEPVVIAPSLRSRISEYWFGIPLRTRRIGVGAILGIVLAVVLPAVLSTILLLGGLVALFMGGIGMLEPVFLRKLPPRLDERTLLMIGGGLLVTGMVIQLLI